MFLVFFGVLLADCTTIFGAESDVKRGQKFFTPAVMHLVRRPGTLCARAGLPHRCNHTHTAPCQTTSLLR